MAFFRLLLFPLSLVYGLLMQLRNFFYETGFFRSQEFTCPVISIGNLTTGGSGKTPFTIYMVRQLQKMGYQPAVVSRGYGRKSQGVIVVSDGEDIQKDVSQTGDEPLLIARSLPGAVVVVGQDRTAAIDAALQINNTDLIVMDDGFQHRAVKRDIDIVLTAWPEIWSQYFVLPSGDLREFKINRERADIEIRTNYTQMPPQKDADYFCHFTNAGVYDVSGKSQGRLDDFSGKSAVAFCGIARPKNFEKTLQNAGLDIRKFVSLADHAPMSAAVIEDVLQICRKEQVALVFCTAKDWIKIASVPALENQFKNIRLFSTDVQVEMSDEENFLRNIKSMLDSLK